MGQPTWLTQPFMFSGSVYVITCITGWRPWLRMAVRLQVKVRGCGLGLRGLCAVHVSALYVTQKPRCSCGMRLVALYKLTVSVKLHLRDERTDKHARQQRPPRSPPSRRVDVAAIRDKPTDGQTPRRRLSVRPSVRPSFRLKTHGVENRRRFSESKIGTDFRNVCHAKTTPIFDSD